MPSICNSQKRGHFCSRKNLIGLTFSSVFISFSLNVFKVEDNQYLRFLNMFLCQGLCWTLASVWIISVFLMTFNVSTSVLWMSQSKHFTICKRRSPLYVFLSLLGMSLILAVVQSSCHFKACTLRPHWCGAHTGAFMPGICQTCWKLSAARSVSQWVIGTQRSRHMQVAVCARRYLHFPR